jgi:small subunit ribosomal protein S27Ae
MAGEKKSTLKHIQYSIEGDKVIRTKKFCPRCGMGVFLADHKDRYHCGRCGYTEFKAGVERIKEKPKPRPQPKKEEVKKPVKEEPKKEEPKKEAPKTPEKKEEKKEKEAHKAKAKFGKK